MPRVALKIVLWGFGWVVPLVAWGVDSHLDPNLLPRPCSACHEGHGTPRSPMLPDAQVQVCLACHDTQARLDGMVRKGLVAPGARPSLISDSLAQPFTHPLSDDSYSRFEPGAVTCTSCHSPHRSGTDRAAIAASPSGGQSSKKLSTRDPSKFEYELCEGCHGQEGMKGRRSIDIGRLVGPGSRSSHPLEAPAGEASPSVLPGLSGGEINCTDCHGNDTPGGPRGPHGSRIRGILKTGYASIDGSNESAATYALCYGCHNRAVLLDSAVFPEHRRHVVDLRASCSTCHDPHGSTENRALIRIGDEGSASEVAPSGLAGILAFESFAPGSGNCYVTCHGYDHGPASYGMAPSADRSPLLQPTAPERSVSSPERSSPPPPRRIRPRRDDRR